jgi:hypothetical protein
MVIRTITGGTDETVTASGVADPPFALGPAGEWNEGIAGTATLRISRTISRAPVRMAA